MQTTLLTIALVLAACGLALFGISLFRQARQRDRNALVVESALGAEREKAATASADDPWPVRALAWVRGFGDQFGGSRIEKALLAPEDRLLLDRCGYNNAPGRAVFLGVRVLLAIGLALLASAWLADSKLGPLFGGLIGLGAGLLLPKFALRSWATRVTRRADQELPLFVDLLRLLQGVGMSMDQSLDVIAEQFRSSVPVLGHELRLANLAYARGRSREASLQRLGEVFDNEDLRSLVRMIVQVDAHGGAVQEPLRQFGVRLREQRKMRMKELSGKLSVKMTLVMMLTLLPALMLVLAGPAVIALVGAVSKLGS
jgi:tight adherence protein C